MTMMISRRRLLATVVVGGGAFAARGAFAQSAPDTLERLRRDKVVKVAIPDNPPYSALEPTGEVTGLAPSLVKIVMERMGVPEVEGIIVPYGQVIPGLQAGRWDIIAACLSMTKQRCEQVLYTDPVVYEGGVLLYVPENLSTPPQSVADLVDMDLIVTMARGSYVLQKCLDAGLPSDNIMQVPELSAEIDALLAKRADIAYTTYYGALAKQKQQPGAFELVYPLPDDKPRGSAVAFRPTDTELHAGFQEEFRAMKDSGEFTELADQFGLAPSEDMLNISYEEECAQAV